MAVIENGKFRFLLDRGDVAGRQDYSACFFINGAIYAARMDDYLKEKTFFFPETKIYLMDQLSSIDVDTEADFIIADSLLTRKAAADVRVS